jgi:glycosyltransferase involved in cell wall biosynthesis
MTRPTVSVIMATYNHGPFVREAIESVLRQEGTDLEFLISDDGSRDDTRDVIASVRDPRIVYTPNTINRGACVVTNELVAAARGEFVALLNSDDRWSVPDKLAYQVDVLRSRPELAATYGRVRFFDRQSRPIPQESLLFGKAFDQENRSQGRWLRRFFDEGNCLCHPTMLIRRACYDELGAYNNRLRQLPDLDMWVRLVRRHPIHVSERPLIDFRILEGENTSSQTPDNSIRTINEHFLIARRFFDGVDAEAFVDGFGDTLEGRTIASPLHLEIEKALQYFRLNPWGLQKPYRMVGLTRMFDLLDDPASAAILRTEHGIDDLWFQRMMVEIDVLRPRASAVIDASKAEAKTMWNRLKRRVGAGS